MADDPRARARRNLVIFWLVLIVLPIVAYFALMLAIGLGMSSGY